MNMELVLWELMFEEGLKEAEGGGGPGGCGGGVEWGGSLNGKD